MDDEDGGGDDNEEGVELGLEEEVTSLDSCSFNTGTPISLYSAGESASPDADVVTFCE